MSRFTVIIDKDLQDIVPGFLENRNKDIISLEQLLKDKNLSEIEKIGHKVSGSSGGYGFNELGVIAKKIEKFAMDDDLDSITSLVMDFKEYVQNVDVKYEEME